MVAPKEVASQCPLSSFKFYKTKEVPTGFYEIKNGTLNTRTPWWYASYNHQSFYFSKTGLNPFNFSQKYVWKIRFRSLCARVDLINKDVTKWYRHYTLFFIVSLLKIKPSMLLLSIYKKENYMAYNTRQNIYTKVSF